MTEKPEVDFIGIGFSKCASTWVYAVLQSHPEICVSSLKETRFFSRKYDKGFSWYRSLFSHCPKIDMIKGEFTPDYAYHPEALERIAANAPNVKLLFVMRNQFARLQSTWQYQYIRGIHNYKSFEAYLASKSDTALERGLYYKYIKVYVDQFGIENIHFMFQEDIRENPQTIARELFEFLGVDDSFQSPVLNQKINKSANRGVHSILLNRLLHKMRYVIRNTFIGKLMLPIIEKMGLKKVAIQLGRFNSSKQDRNYHLDNSLSFAMITEIQQYYVADMNKLSKLLQREVTDPLLTRHVH